MPTVRALRCGRDAPAGDEPDRRACLVVAAEEAAVNVQEAHTQIQRYYKSVLSNRGLILKTFGVVRFLVVLFGTIVPR